MRNELGDDLLDFIQGEIRAFVGIRCNEFANSIAHVNFLMWLHADLHLSRCDEFTVDNICH